MTEQSSQRVPDAGHNHASLKQLARERGRPMSELFVLAPANDPFLADGPGRRAKAQWFADLWQRFGFGDGTHLRRIHYRLISQARPVRMLDGKGYRNTLDCWKDLGEASRDARLLELVPIDAFIDRRNAEPIICLPTETATPPFLSCSGSWMGCVMPYPPRLHLIKPTIPQPHHVELWCEKTTMNDVLEPLAESYGANLITGSGELSLTACRDVIDRGRQSGLPVRILYLSDFDPAGAQMPVAVASKIDFLRHRRAPQLDIMLEPIVLTHEQCVTYKLPRTPIKEGERRTAAFEARFGAGATELDALEALHPGELRRIVVRELDRYIDRTLERRIGKAAEEMSRELARVSDEVLETFAPDLEKLHKRILKLDHERVALFEKIELQMRKQAPDVSAIEWPEPKLGRPHEDPLYRSDRDYVEQVAVFKRHQGKQS